MLWVSETHSSPKTIKRQRVRGPSLKHWVIALFHRTSQSFVPLIIHWFAVWYTSHLPVFATSFRKFRRYDFHRLYGLLFAGSTSCSLAFALPTRTAPQTGRGQRSTTVLFNPRLSLCQASFFSCLSSDVENRPFPIITHLLEAAPPTWRIVS